MNCEDEKIEEKLRDLISLHMLHIAYYTGHMMVLLKDDKNTRLQKAIDSRIELFQTMGYYCFNDLDLESLVPFLSNFLGDVKALKIKGKLLWIKQLTTNLIHNIIEIFYEVHKAKLDHFEEITRKIRKQISSMTLSEE